MVTSLVTLFAAKTRNNGDGTFTDVTAKAGVGAEGLLGMGVAVGDSDNDGFPDLFVLGYGRCILLSQKWRWRSNAPRVEAQTATS